MCGIVGAVSTRNIVPVLIEGLRRLEYRGYDSCGVAVQRDGQLERARTVSRVADLDTTRDRGVTLPPGVLMPEVGNQCRPAAKMMISGMPMTLRSRSLGSGLR